MRETILSELEFSVSLVLSGTEVVPRFRVNGDDGVWTIFTPLPETLEGRERCMRLAAGFMAWKSATSFVMSGELVDPDMVHAIAVTRDGVIAAGRLIRRTPLSVGDVEWFPASMVGDEIRALLPRGRIVLDDETVATLRQAFGPDGEFKTQRLH